MFNLSQTIVSKSLSKKLERNKPIGEYTYLPTPPLGQDMTQGQILSGV